jgi:hypothetical protein
VIPTVGRIVHYILPKGFRNVGEHRAAIITRVWDSEPSEESAVQLTIFMDGVGESHINGDYVDSLRYGNRAKQDPEAKKEGTWHEPERLEKKASTPAHETSSKRSKSPS